MADVAKDLAVIGEEASFSGKFKGQDLTVLGRFEGEIEIRGRLRVGPKGLAKAKVRATAADVEGEIEGDVRCESLSLMPTARVRGTITAKRLAVQEGALVEGSINPASTHAVDPVQPAPAPPAAAGPVAPAPSETKSEPEPPK